jgi:hypothetical protein
MAKQGQHKHDANDQRKSKGHNNPDKSQTITTGTYKKQETYRRQAAEHENPNKQPQAARHEWNPDTRDEPSTAGSTRARDSSIRSGRSGSDSNADAGTRGH